MKPMPHIVAVMTPFPHTIETSRTLHDAKLMMAQGEVRHLPVVDAGKLVGILSDRDIKLVLSVTKIKDADRAVLVQDACNYEAYVVDAQTRLDHVVAHMAEHRIGSALVTKNGKLVGIFTTTDACRELAQVLQLHYPDA